MRVLLAAAAAIGACALGSTAASAQSSYKTSCVNYVERGGYVEASCLAPGGQFVRTSINRGQCPGQDIANIGGRLSCGWADGGRGGPPRGGFGDRGPPQPRYGYDDRGPPQRDYGYRDRREDDDEDGDYRPRRRYGY